MSEPCLICQKPLDGQKPAYHEKCSRSFFGMYPAPGLDVSIDKIHELATIEVSHRITLTGVQKKLSLGIDGTGRNRRFTIVALWGRFVLKPPANDYPNLPENEDLVIRLAAKSGIPTVPHAMIHLTSGELAYICRRIDRLPNGEKIAMEDMCQVSQRLTEDKYRGSVEYVGKLIAHHSVYPGFDLVDLFERVLFNFFVGNADMHLKNYSLIETPKGMRLAPAYDLVSTALVLPEDPEESALTINGKKRKIDKSDFDVLAQSFGIALKTRDNIYAKFAGLYLEYVKLINSSFLPESQKKDLMGLIRKRMKSFEC